MGKILIELMKQITIFSWIADPLGNGLNFSPSAVVTGILNQMKVFSESQCLSALTWLMAWFPMERVAK
jgi:hypothetical protein